MRREFLLNNNKQPISLSSGKVDCHLKNTSLMRVAFIPWVNCQSIYLTKTEKSQLLTMINIYWPKIVVIVHLRDIHPFSQRHKSGEKPSRAVLQAIVDHFMSLFDVASLSGVYARMNDLYSKLGEVHNVMRTLKDLLGLSTLRTIVADPGVFVPKNM